MRSRSIPTAHVWRPPASATRDSGTAPPRVLVAQAPLVANIGSDPVARSALAVGFADIAGGVRLVVADDEKLWTLDRFTATQLSQTTTFDRGSFNLRRDAVLPVAIAQGKLFEGFSDTIAYLRTLDGSAADLELRHGTGDATGVALAPAPAKRLSAVTTVLLCWPSTTTDSLQPQLRR